MYQNIYYEREKNLIHLWDDKLGYRNFRYNNIVYQLCNEDTPLKTIFGQNVISVKNNFGDETLLERDVNPEIKTLIQKYHTTDDIPKSLNIGFIDIETDSSLGWEPIKKYESKLLSICIRDYNDKKSYQFLIDEDKKFSLKNSESVFFCVVKNEVELFQRLLQFLSIKKYHILSGWNSENFDFPYIVKRGRKVIGDDIDRLSPIGIVKDDEKDLNKVHIAGISLLDYMMLYKKFSEGERTSFSLNSIAELELKTSKKSYEGTLHDLYRNDLNHFIEYNIQDTLLIEQLEEKLQYLKTTIRLSHKGHIPYEQIFFQSRIIEGAVLTSLKRKGLVATNKKKYTEQRKDELLGTLENWNELKKKIEVKKTDDGYDVDLDLIEDDYVFIINGKEKQHTFTKEEFEEKIEDKIIQLNTRGGVKKLADSGEGAYVKSPLRGRYKWIIDLDFTSLYPSIMRTLNISPETKIAVIENWNCETFTEKDRFNIKNINTGTITTISKDKLFHIINDKKYIISCNGVIYTQEKKGIIPLILDEWFDDRINFQKLSQKCYKEGKVEESKTYDILDYITKILLNSVYGVLLSPSYRFYDKDNGEAVTITGQYLIKHAERKVNEFLNRKKQNSTPKDYVVAMDTDSTLIDVDDFVSSKDDIPELATELQTYVNESISPFVKEKMFVDNHFLAMKQEMIAKSGLFIEKKRYALHVIEKKNKIKDELEIKGIDTQRTNFPLYFRKTLKSIIIQNILDGASKEEIEKKILELKNNMILQPITDIMIPTGVKNVTKYYDVVDRYKKGTPIFSKSAINHNLLLKILNLDKEYEPIYDGDKIKYCYVTENEYGFDTMALKENSPKEIFDFIQKFINYDKIFENQLLSKLENWFIALGWKQEKIKIPRTKTLITEKNISKVKTKTGEWW